MNFKTTATAFGALLFLAAPWSAQAADMPVYKGRSVIAYYNWTGFYIGGNVGYGWSSGDGTITLGGATGPYSGSGNGAFGGLQAGYNYQVGSFVAGIEADIQASGGRGNLNGTAGAAVITATAKTPWFATVRGRLGYAFDRSLVYVTGGGLFGNAKLDGTVSTTGAFSSSTNYRAWTVGGGLEYAFLGNWTGKIEYLYVGNPNEVPVPPGATVTGSARTHLVRVGLNYKFSGPVFSRW